MATSKPGLEEAHKKLASIQKTLKAPKNQKNDFGGYNYRSCEDILEAVKPLLDGAVLTLSDEVIQMGDRFYVKATAKFVYAGAEIVVTALARESITRKGMDDSQITGSTSSYARKYALNGLFLIDDTKDADAQGDRAAKTRPAAASKPAEPAKQYPVSENQLKYLTNLIVTKGVDIDKMIAYYKVKNITDLTASQASAAISELQRRPLAQSKPAENAAKASTSGTPATTPTVSPKVPEAADIKKPTETGKTDQKPLIKAELAARIMSRSDLSSNEKARELQKLYGLVVAKPSGAAKK